MSSYFTVDSKNGAECCLIRMSKVQGSKMMIGVGVLALSGAIIATWLTYGSMGNYAFAVLGSGSILGCALMLCGCQRHRDFILPTRWPYDEVESGYRGRILEQQGTDRTALVRYSLIGSRPEFVAAKAEILSKIASGTLTPEEDSALGVMMGMAVGNAVGAPFECLNYLPEGYLQKDKSFNLTKEGMVGQIKVCPRFNLKPGQWTDGTSMGLCLADVLIESCEVLDGMQLMWAFYDWWHYGYNNAFTQGEERPSVGLDGNIRLALNAFESQKRPRRTSGYYKTTVGDRSTSGNGGLMRLGAVALASKSLEGAQGKAAKQSLVTHQGDEAEACCALMASWLFKACHSKNTLEDLFNEFAEIDWGVASVNQLARSQGEWNWQDPNFTFHQSRLDRQPDYIGSYAMDALAMALHCIWTTHSFEEAVIKASTRGGDADSVGAITGQIAGAIYGFKAIPKDWVDAVQQWDRGGEIVARAYLLTQRKF